MLHPEKSRNNGGELGVELGLAFEEVEFKGLAFEELELEDEEDEGL